MTHAVVFVRSTPGDVVVMAREVDDAKVKEDREVRSLVTRCKTKISVVELAAAMRIDPPCVWTLGHDEETRTVLASFVQATNAPQESIARSRELWV